MPPAGALPAPTVTAGRPAIPGLVLENVLGAGGMGVVFKARQLKLDRDVAVKFLRDPHLVDSAHGERFKQEARAVARLQHPNLVQLHEFGEVARTDGPGTQPYLVLEYVSGGNLGEHLRSARLSAASTARLVESLADAIHYAHRQGVIHRDLKPTNVLLKPSDAPDTRSAAQGQLSLSELRPGTVDFVPKITDFGLAKFLAGSSLTATGDVLGTPSYMAPEQTMGSADITPAVDVYGLGAILYEALTGRPPFEAETQAATVRQVKESEPLPPSRLDKLVPRDLETICLKCLRKEPGRRYASAKELADDLRRFQSGEPIRARRVSTAERALIWCRRRPMVAGLLAAVIIAVAAGLGGIAWQAKIAADRSADARKAQELAQLEKQRAEENLQKLREKVDRLSELGRDLAKDPRLRKPALALLEEALAFYDQMLPKETMDRELRAEAARMYGEVANTYHQTGKWQQAVDAYRRQAELLTAMVQDEPANAAYRVRLTHSYIGCGHVLRDLGEMPQARATYQKALDVQEQLVADDPKDLAGQVGIALILLNQVTTMSLASDIDEIERLLGRAVKVCRDATKAAGPGKFRFELGLVLESLGAHLDASGKRSEALAAASEAVSLYQAQMNAEPRNLALQRYTARAITWRGNLLAHTGKAQDAEQAYQEAVKLLSPLATTITGEPVYRMDLANALANWAELLKNTSRKDEAEAVLRQAIAHFSALKDSFPEAKLNHRMLAGCYMKLVSWLWEFGRPDAADEPYRLALAVAPDDSVVNNDLAWFLVTHRDARLWKPADAVRLAQQAVKAEPKRANYWNTLGVAHYRNGDDQAALEALKTSMNLGAGGNSIDWFFMAMVSWKLGDRVEAQMWFDRALQWMDKHLPNDDELRRFRAEAQALLRK
jgi:tetratricopeptide (TPR) repeat protein